MKTNPSPPIYSPLKEALECNFRFQSIPEGGEIKVDGFLVSWRRHYVSAAPPDSESETGWSYRCYLAAFLAAHSRLAGPLQ
jgi:hypothetical protein